MLICIEVELVTFTSLVLIIIKKLCKCSSQCKRMYTNWNLASYLYSYIERIELHHHHTVEPPRRGHFGILPLSLVERSSLSRRLFCIKSVNPCISECPLLGGSTNRGSTVYIYIQNAVHTPKYKPSPSIIIIIIITN